MRINRPLVLAVLLTVAVIASTQSLHAEVSPDDAMRTCKNTVMERLPNVPRAYISVSRGSVTPLGGGYTILFRAEPPNGQRSSGFCSISKRGEVENFRFDSPDPGPPVMRNNPSAGISAQAAMQTCKNTAMERLPNVPRAYISVSRGSNTGDGGYTIHFQAQPPNGQRTSGFCIISRNGNVQNFQFNPPEKGPPIMRNNPSAGISPEAAMRTCKNRVAERLPSVPLAYINTYRGSDEADGSYMINFNARPPSGRKSDGFCVVSRDGNITGFRFDRFDLP
jgi:hypothetical protein